MTPEELIKQGKPVEALAALEPLVRASPADPKLRVFLFQLLSVLGRWERAMTQLNVAAEMDAGTLLMAQVCRPALQCEVFRSEVFSGQRAPLVLGEPEEWIGMLVEACRLTCMGGGAGKIEAAGELRAKAFDLAPASAGEIDGQAFMWIADADTRLGPMLEAIVDGKYYWVPFARLASVEIEKPKDLRDAVWLPAKLTLSNGGEKVGLIPTRYPGSEQSTDGGVCLARTTTWTSTDDLTNIGLGQRVLATDAGEHAIMACGRISIAR